MAFAHRQQAVSGGWGYPPLLFSDNRILARGLRAAQANRTKNIKIAPPVGGSRLEKRISFTLFEPFNSIFPEARAKKLCQKNQNKIQNQEKKSGSKRTDDPWSPLYRSFKNILPLILI